jgi:hypothetical protein
MIKKLLRRFGIINYGYFSSLIMFMIRKNKSEIPLNIISGYHVIEEPLK